MDTISAIVEKAKIAPSLNIVRYFWPKIEWLRSIGFSLDLWNAYAKLKIVPFINAEVSVDGFFKRFHEEQNTILKKRA